MPTKRSPSLSTSEAPQSCQSRLVATGLPLCVQLLQTQNAMVNGLPARAIPELPSDYTKEDILTAEDKLTKIMQSFESANI